MPSTGHHLCACRLPPPYAHPSFAATAAAAAAAASDNERDNDDFLIMSDRM